MVWTHAAAMALLAGAAICGDRPTDAQANGILPLDKQGLFQSDGFDRLVVVNFRLYDQSGQFSQHLAELRTLPMEWPWNGAFPPFSPKDKSSIGLECGKGCVANCIAVLQAKVPALELWSASLSFSMLDFSHSSYLVIPLRGRFPLEANKINYLGRIAVTITRAPGTLTSSTGSKHPIMDAGRIREQTETSKTFSGGAYELEFGNDDHAMQWDLQLLRQHERFPLPNWEVVKSVPIIRPALEEDR